MTARQNGSPRRGIPIVAFGIVMCMENVVLAQLSSVRRFERDVDVSGVISADRIVVPRGVTLRAGANVELIGRSIEIAGVLVGDDGINDLPAVNIEISATENVLITGRVIAGRGASAGPTAMPAYLTGVDPLGQRLVVARGVPGGRGGTVTIKAGPNAALYIGPNALVAAGDGGAGRAVMVEAAHGSPSRAPENVQVFGGNGGGGGSVILEAGLFDIRGTVHVGNGGHGGAAVATGGDGASDFPPGVYGYDVGRGAYAATFGGAGGASGEILGGPVPVSLSQAKALRSHFVGGTGGSGGAAEAHAGRTLRSIKEIKEMEPSASFVYAEAVARSGTQVSLQSFKVGSCVSVGGDGGFGQLAGGAGGSALSDGATDAFGPGNDGQDSKSNGGDGGDGGCSFGVGGSGGSGDNASATGASNGSDGGIDFAEDANNGGRGGDNFANGGDGGDGGDCALRDGNGGRGGRGDAGEAGYGGAGGLCSDGGRGGDSIATGGDGGQGRNGGRGGKADANRGNRGGKGGLCVCPLGLLNGDGGDGGRGGNTTSTGGDGGPDYGGRWPNKGDDGDGGDANSGRAGDAGNGGAGMPGGVGGSGGLSGGTGGSAGGSEGSGGKGNGGDNGSNGAPGEGVGDCPPEGGVACCTPGLTTCQDAVAADVCDGAGNVVVDDGLCANAPDSDSDGVLDACDECPFDTNKVLAGSCGCGVAETSDSDNDGTLDCNDLCPSDVNKVAPGECGCGVADDDGDGDGILDCIDNCDIVNTDQADCNQNEIGDLCDIRDGELTDANEDDIADECGACCGGGGCDQLPEAACLTEPGEVFRFYKGDGTDCRDYQTCVEIPTVSEWGLVALMLVLLAAGTIVLRRRVAAVT